MFWLLLRVRRHFSCGDGIPQPLRQQRGVLVQRVDGIRFPDNRPDKRREAMRMNPASTATGGGNRILCRDEGFAMNSDLFLKRATGSILFAAIAALGFATAPLLSRAAALEVERDLSLTTNAVYETVSVAPNATLDLRGNKLTTSALSGGGTIISATQDGTELFDGCFGLDFVETPSNNSEVFVDTLYTPLCTDRVETKVVFGAISGAEMIFSSRKTSTAQTLTCLRNNNQFRFDRNTKYGHANSGTVAVNTPYEVVADFGNLHYTVNAEGPFSTTSGTGDFTAYTNIFLFAAGVLNGSVYEIGNFARSCKMYYFRVYDKDDNLKVNMVPVIRDGVVGFYDTIRKMFLAPAKGALLAYYQLDYVQSPGENISAHTYVNTGYTPLLTDRVETKIRPGDASNYQTVFSARATSETNTFSCVIVPNGGIFTLRFDHHVTTPYVYHKTGGTVTAFVKDKDYEIVMDGNTLGFSVNGVMSATNLTANSDDESASTGLTLRLFAMGTKGSGHSTYANACRMYYFRVYDKDGNLKLDLVPARRIPDGSVGFHNRLDGVFILPECQQGIPATPVLTPGPFQPADLTQPDGRCWASVKDTTYRATTVTNLFNNNYVNGDSSTTRFIVVNIGNQKPAIDYDFGEGNAQAVNMYRIYGGGEERTPLAWEILGSDTAFGSSDETGWTLLDARSSEPDWARSECRTKVFVNDAAYRYYRFKVKENGSSPHFEITQIEYCRIQNTFFPGELHVDVEDGAAATNSTVRFGGNLKLVKEGAGAFLSSVSNQFYNGGTDVRLGGFIVGAPLATVLTMADGTSLGFHFVAKNAVPLLTLQSGSSIPDSLDISIGRDIPFGLPSEGVTLTTGYDFSGTALNFVNPSAGLSRLRKDASGNLVVYGQSGLVLSIR